MLCCYVNSAVTVSARELWMIVLQRTLLLRLQQMASSLRGIWTSRDVTNKVACMFLFCTFTVCCWYVGDKYCMSLLLLSMLMFDVVCVHRLLYQSSHTNVQPYHVPLQRAKSVTYWFAGWKCCSDCKMTCLYIRCSYVDCTCLTYIFVAFMSIVESLCCCLLLLWKLSK